MHKESNNKNILDFKKIKNKKSKHNKPSDTPNQATMDVFNYLQETGDSTEVIHLFVNDAVKKLEKEIEELREYREENTKVMNEIIKENKKYQKLIIEYNKNIAELELHFE